MTPQQKAKELVEKYHALEQCNNHSDLVLDGNICAHLAKQCALIAVEELINQMKPICTDYSIGVGFWQLVKEEIELI
jgi:hypothetical protein